MFKKLLKNLTGNIEDMAKDMMDSKSGTSGAPTGAPSGAQFSPDMQKIFDQGAASAGVVTPNTAKEDPNDPKLQPVHGVTIYDYAAGAAKIGQGCSKEQICEALGIERPMWDEAETTWNNRMRDDNTYNVVNVYSSYFGKVKEHPRLGGLVAQNKFETNIPDEEAKANLERLESDKHYFFEIQGAMEAAYANGIDGAQLLIDNLGLSVSQVNGAGTKYMNDFSVMAQMMDYQESKKKEYSLKFSEQSGGSGPVDDIKF